MIATYNQVKLEMSAKEADFARELQRAQYSQPRAFNFITKIFGRAKTPTRKRL